MNKTHHLDGLKFETLRELRRLIQQKWAMRFCRSYSCRTPLVNEMTARRDRNLATVIFTHTTHSNMRVHRIGWFENVTQVSAQFSWINKRTCENEGVCTR